MDERLNSMEQLAKDIEMLAKIVNSNYKGEVASASDQNYVSDESSFTNSLFSQAN